MQVFAIKHKPTGGFLPETGGGYTHSEPCTYLIPRLFTTKKGACCALTWWLKGWTSVAHTRDYFGEYDETWQTEHILERKAADMEVIPLTLEAVYYEQI